MNCVHCLSETYVIDSRAIHGAVRRRRECDSCGHRFSTREIETSHLKSLLKNNEEYLRLLKKYKELSDSIKLGEEYGSDA